MKEYHSFILSKVDKRLTNVYFEITLLGSEGLAISKRGNNVQNAYVAALNIFGAKILFSKSNFLVAKLFKPGTNRKTQIAEEASLIPEGLSKDAQL